MSGPLLTTSPKADTARVAKKVFRTELNPVDLLERAAFVYRGQGRARARRAPLHVRGSSASGRGASPTRSAAPAWRRATGSRRCSRTLRPCWKRTSGCRPPGASSSPSTPASRATRSPTSSSTPAPESCCSTPSSPGSSMRIDLGGVHVIRVDDTGSADDPYEQLPGRRVARPAGEPARRRGGDDLGQLHLRHHRSPERRPVHVPRRLPQRPQRGDRRRPLARSRSSSGCSRCSTATAGASPGP